VNKFIANGTFHKIKTRHFTYCTLNNVILTEVEIGQNVLIPIPNVDRGKGDPRNLMAVVTERVHNGYKPNLLQTEHFIKSKQGISHTAH
jgi:hypothetical protein